MVMAQFGSIISECVDQWRAFELNDTKKNAAFIQWGEHPIPDAGRQTVSPVNAVRLPRVSRVGEIVFPTKHQLPFGRRRIETPTWWPGTAQTLMDGLRKSE